MELRNDSIVEKDLILGFYRVLVPTEEEVEERAAIFWSCSST